MGVKRIHVALALLILIPSFVNLGVPIYNRGSPEVLGLPFFYWFQTVWLFATTGFYYVFAHLRERQHDRL